MDLHSTGESINKMEKSNSRHYACETCGKKFARNCLLKRHVRSHTKETPYVCKTCNAKFAQPGSLRKHEKIHLGIKDFKCTQCPMAFRQKENLMTHIKKIHPTDETIRSTKLGCQYCESYFSNNKTLSHHLISVHAGKPRESLDNTISNVMADLMSMSQLTDEENKSEEKPKVNNYLENLKITMSNGVRLYNCNVCDYGFKKPSDLLRHSVVHSDERPHQCPLCEKCYRLPTVLRDHMKNHHFIKFKSNKNIVLQECIYTTPDQGNASEQAKHTVEEPSQYQPNLPKITIEVNLPTTNYGLSMPLLSDTESSNSPFLIGAQSNVNDETPTQVEEAKFTTRLSENRMLEDQYLISIDIGDITQNNPSANVTCHDTPILLDYNGTPQDAENVAILFKDLLEESNQLNISNKIIDISPANINQKLLIPPSISDNGNLNSSFLAETISSQKAEASQLLTLQSDKGKVVINVIDEFLIRKVQPSNLVVKNEPNEPVIELSYYQDDIQNQVNDNIAFDDITEVVLYGGDQINMANIDLLGKADNTFTPPEMKISNAPNKYVDSRKKITALADQLWKGNSSNLDLDDNIDINNLVDTEQNSLTSDPSEINKQLLVDSYFNVTVPAISNTDNLTGEKTELSMLETAVIDNDATKNAISVKCELENIETVNIAEQTNINQCNEQTSELPLIDNEMSADPALLIDTLLKPTSNGQRTINSGKTCEECSATFKRNYDLVQHRRTHTQEKPYQCNICGKSFTFKSAMKVHQYTHMSAEERPKFNCHVCGKTLSSRSCFKGHMRLHNNSKPYQCPECKLRFRYASNRRLHIINHHLLKKGRKKSLKDMILDLDMTDVNNTDSQNKLDSITQPEQAMPDEKQMSKRKPQTKYTCDTCKKVFTQWSVTLRHLLSHTAVKPHKCAACGAAFKQTSSLKLHELTHKPPPFNRPHACPYCPRRFTQKYNLNIHIKTHLR